MKVLVACEYSGIVRDAFTKKGHYAMSCDILPTESEGLHYQGNVMDIINDGWDLMIAHPPCTYLSNAGARWLYPKGKLDEERYLKGLETKNFFMNLWNAPIDKICIENPKPSKIYNLPKHNQKVQPYEYGHPYSKGTYLWLKNIPILLPYEMANIEGYWCGSYTSKQKDKRVLGKTAKERSKFWSGIANQMANQWG
tara:strand:- start:44 stop:631 length:588 start_codon:yes stop_codon:yes gene_type:complete